MQPAAHLPYLLPCLECEMLRGTTQRFISRLMEREGADRGWPRLLYSSLLNLCPQTPVDAFSAVLSHLVPDTLRDARAQELSSCAETLVAQAFHSHPTLFSAPMPFRRSSPDNAVLVIWRCAWQLSEAALHHAGGREANFCTNVANMFASWPPSDRSLAAVLRALGGSSPVGGGSPLLVFCRKRRGATLQRGLATHVQRARTKQLKGPSLDHLTRLLKMDKEQVQDESGDEEGGSEGCQSSGEGDERVEAGHQTCGDNSDERAKLARVEAALEKLRAFEPLYTAAELPDIAIDAFPGSIAAGGGEADSQARSRDERRSESRPRKAPRRN